jgi:cysteine desulfurase
MKPTYLDWAATAPPMQDILAKAATVAIDHFANPSSIHSAGADARRVIEESRQVCADEINADPGHVYFTSGGSEGNNIILTSILTRKAKGSLVVSGIEHASVYEPARLIGKSGFEVRYVSAEKSGRISADRFAAKIEGDTVMASIMLVNNETGAIQPVSEIAERLRGIARTKGRKIHIHCDAVQGFGKLPVDVVSMDIDSLSTSGHKIGAPRGIGLLYLRRQLEPVYRGGGQEGALRPGTENLFAIDAFAGATRAWASQRLKWHSDSSHLRTLLLDKISRIPGARFLDSDSPSSGSEYSPYIMMASFPPIPGEILVRVMSDRGFAISTGSACSSRGKKNLRVLDQMGIDRDFANSAIRVSTGSGTTEAECASFCDSLHEAVTSLQNQIKGA